MNASSAFEGVHQGEARHSQREVSAGPVDGKHDENGVNEKVQSGVEMCLYSIHHLNPISWSECRVFLGSEFDVSFPCDQDFRMEFGYIILCKSFGGECVVFSVRRSQV